MSDYDEDGFMVDVVGPTIAALKRPPVIAEVPSFFAGCVTMDEAIVKCMNKLNEPYSHETHGIDEMYRRLANALIALLADRAGIAP